MRKIWKAFLSLCTIVGIVFFAGLLIFLALGIYNSRNTSLSDHTYLVVDFSRKFAETSSTDLIDDILGEQKTSVYDLVRMIEVAAIDPRIGGLVARLNSTSLDLAQVQDIARAVNVFKSSGKKTLAYSSGFGPFGQGNREYYLATFFEKIYMQPHTYVGITGINVEIPFFRKLLDKIGVEAEFYAREEYKTAMMSFTEDKIPETYKKEMTGLAQNLFDLMKVDIVYNRSLNINFDEVVNNAPVSAEDAVKIGLIDGVMYAPEVEQQMKDEGVKNFIQAEDYMAYLVPNSGNLPVIAILNLDGIINDGESGNDIDGEFTIGSDSVLADLNVIAEIKDLKAVVVRINSPGGSYNAADEIYFALQKLKKDKNIPIVVSQSGYAASGGYFISLAGDKIIAEPTTITGSIGVLGGKFVLADLWKKLDVEWADIKVGENADILSFNKPFSEKEKAVFNRSLDEVYADFKAKVAENRHLTRNIDEVAKGKVWTGAQAFELGLIDMLGGFDEAIFEAKKLAGLAADAKYKQAIFPQQKSFAEKLRDLFYGRNVNIKEIVAESGVDIRDLKLFKRWQYDTVLLPFKLGM